MNAVVIHENGGPEKMIFSEVAEPTPAEDQVVVDIEAAGVNFIDTYQRSGLYKMDLPFTPGLEGGGTIVDIGDGVHHWGVGDRVAWASGIGSYAQKVAVSQDALVGIPSGVTTDTAAAVMLQGLTAHYLATDTFPLRPDFTCLIHAGAGGVGLLLTQIARIKGAQVVTTVSTQEKAELSRRAGAHHVVLYNQTDFAAEIESLLGPHAIDVVYDGVGAATFNKGLEVLKARGMMVTFGNASGPVPEISPLVLSQKGSLFLTRPTLRDHIATPDELRRRSEDLFGWVSGGEISVTIGSTFGLDRAAEAHRALEGRATTGKVLLKP